MAKLNGAEWDEGEWQRQHGAEVERLQSEIARLREALGGLKHCDGCYCEAAFSMLDGSHPRHSVECEAASDALDSPSGHWPRQHDAEVRAQAIQDLADRYRETCRSLYIQAKREGTREEQERAVGKCREVEDLYGPKNNGAIAARECIAAILEQEENDE